MADVGLDYAGRSPGGAAVRAAGFQFVMRYLSRYTAKCITAGEYQDMNANGVGVGLVFEDYANQALQGYNQGVADAQYALAQARSVGWPENRPIYFAVDFDISDAQKPAAGQYMKGAIAVLGLGRVGAYGGYYWIKYCAENGLASFFWQAVAWSGGQQHAVNNLFQRLGGTTVNGTACDINDARKADYGQSNAQGQEDPMLEQDIKNFCGAVFMVNADAEDLAHAGQSWHDVMYYLAGKYQHNIHDYADQANRFFQVAETRYGYEGQIQTALKTGAVPDDVPAALAAIADLQAKADLSDAQKKQIADLQAQVDAANSGDNIIITRKGFAGLFDTIKQYFSKKN